MALRRLLAVVALAAAHRHPSTPRAAALRCRGGDDDRDAKLGGAFAAGADAAERATSAAAEQLEAHKTVTGLGETLGAAYERAMAAFDGLAPADAADARTQMSDTVDASLELLFVKQLGLVRKKLLGAEPVDVASVESAFADAAADAARPGSDWDSASETASVAAVARELGARAARATDVAAKARKQQQAYLQVFQLYQAQIAQLKQATGSQPAQLVASYRVPDSDLALSATRSDDRTTLTLGCVPDDSAPLLGPQGFVRGVTPLNVGITLNLHV